MKHTVHEALVGPPGRLELPIRRESYFFSGDPVPNTRNFNRQFLVGQIHRACLTAPTNVPGKPGSPPMARPDKFGDLIQKNFLDVHQTQRNQRLDHFHRRVDFHPLQFFKHDPISFLDLLPKSNYRLDGAALLVCDVVV